MKYDFLFNIFIFLAAACLVVPLANRFKLGAVLGYLATGMLIGPYGFALIDNGDEVMHFAEFGVIMMLFLIGLELEPKNLWRMRKHIVGLGGLQVLLSAFALTGIGMLMGFAWNTSLAVGLALSLSSTALVVQILQEKNLTHTSLGEAAISVLLFQDMAVIPILLALPLLAVGGQVIPPSPHDLLANFSGFTHALIVGAVIIGVIVVGHLMSRYLLRVIARTNVREVFTATALALIVGVTLVMEMIGVSPALGAFVAGVVLANSEYKQTLWADIEPFKGLLLGLFFISVGMGMDLDLVLQKPFLLAGAVFLFMGVKAIILYILGWHFAVPRNQNLGFAIGLSQGGEFNFVLFPIISGLALLTAEQASFLTLAVALSIAATPLAILAYNKFIVPRFLSMLPQRPYDLPPAGGKVIVAGYGRYGQVIGRFLMAQGTNVTILEKNPDQIETLRKFGVRGYYGDATRLDLLRTAGAASAQIFVVAINDPEVSLKIVRLLQNEFPNLKIFVRARNRRHAYLLHKAGIDHYTRDTFDSSLNMAQQIMTELGSSLEDVQDKAEKFRQHDEDTLAQSFDFFESDKKMAHFAKTRAIELENILQSDNKANNQPN